MVLSASAETGTQELPKQMGGIFLVTVKGTAQGYDTGPYKDLAKGWLVIKGTIYRS